jgi:hypothetical protein
MVLHGILFAERQRTLFINFKPLALLLVNANRIIFSIAVGGEIGVYSMCEIREKPFKCSQPVFSRMNFATYARIQRIKKARVLLINQFLSKCNKILRHNLLQKCV